jgi:hypothetical protein
MTDDDKHRVLAAAEKHIPHALAFQAKNSATTFDLVFEKV